MEEAKEKRIENREKTKQKKFDKKLKGMWWFVFVFRYTVLPVS